MFGRESEKDAAERLGRPPYRTFKVTRFKLGCETPANLEEIFIAAHNIKYGPMGILIFEEGVAKPGAEHLIERTTRVLRSFEEVEEVTTPATSILTM